MGLTAHSHQPLGFPTQAVCFMAEQTGNLTFNRLDRRQLHFTRAVQPGRDDGRGTEHQDVPASWLVAPAIQQGALLVGTHVIHNVPFVWGCGLKMVVRHGDAPWSSAYQAGALLLSYRTGGRRG